MPKFHLIISGVFRGDKGGDGPRMQYDSCNNRKKEKRLESNLGENFGFHKLTSKKKVFNNIQCTGSPKFVSQYATAYNMLGEQVHYLSPLKHDFRLFCH